MSGKTYIAREEVIHEVGLNAAIVHERLKFIVEQNARENRHAFKGKFWTKNTYEEWRKYFPFFSVKQIRSAFSKLVSAELVLTGDFNKQNTDRTLWYTTSEQPLDIESPELPSRADGNAQKGSSACAQKGSSACAQRGRSYKELENLKIPLSSGGDLFIEFLEVHPKSRPTPESLEIFLGLSDQKRAVDAARSYADEVANYSGEVRHKVMFSDNWLKSPDKWPAPRNEACKPKRPFSPNMATVKKIKNRDSDACKYMNREIAQQYVDAGILTVAEFKAAGVSL